MLSAQKSELRGMPKKQYPALCEVCRQANNLANKALAAEASPNRTARTHRPGENAASSGFATSGLDWNAEKTLTTYRLRDEQKAVFAI